ncbi:hypothetical protein [Rhizobium sp. FKY42]|uniref:hypothetical protein n=1 Tax=Rhizobium sp. FKY42 TaxID=2562310 RepID=UPI0010BFD8F8|nr:hypothetical protein [Rhizobium sp. FKY42]
MKHFLKGVVVAVIAAACSHAAFAEDAHVAPIKSYVTSKVTWLKDPALIAAIKAQNAKNAALSEAEIIALDKKWRAEVEAADKPMIKAILDNEASKFLKAQQAASSGVISEVFVMDNKGLNVGQSEITSDYWQGDEAKFKKSFGVGKDAIFVDGVEKDESTQALQSQVSLTIVDEAGAPIGAVTIGINVDAL